MSLSRMIPLPAVLLALMGCGGDRPPASPPAPPAAPAPAAGTLVETFPGRDPALRWDASGNLHVVYVEDREGGAALRYRRIGGSPAGPVPVSPSGLAVSAHGEASPVLEVLAGGALVSAYPVALPGRWKNEIHVQRSADGGATWEEPRLLHEPRKDGSHSYLSSAVSGTGELVFAWLDDRAGQMGLHTAASPDGRSFSPVRTLDPKTCQCCGTDLLAGEDGSVWLAYRAWEPGDVRDIRVLAAGPGGAFDRGTKLANDGWVLPGCPHSGARMARTPDGRLWTAWFTGGGKGPGLYVSSSADGGRTFAPPFQLAESGTVRQPEIGLLPDGRLAVVYQTTDAEGGHPLELRVRDPRTGDWSAPRIGALQGKYPRLAVAGGKAAVAFTCPAEQGTRVVVADWLSFESGKLRPEGCREDAGEEEHGRH